MRYSLIIIIILCPFLILAQIDISDKREEPSVYDRCSHLTLDHNADTVSTAFCAKYRSKEYSFQTTYVNNKPFALMIYHNDINEESQVAEFWYVDGWQRCDYHCKSVSYSDCLLKVYLKKKKFIRYSQIWYS